MHVLWKMMFGKQGSSGCGWSHEHDDMWCGKRIQRFGLARKQSVFCVGLINHFSRGQMGVQTHWVIETVDGNTMSLIDEGVCLCDSGYCIIQVVCPQYSTKWSSRKRTQNTSSQVPIVSQGPLQLTVWFHRPGRRLLLR